MVLLWYANRVSGHVYRDSRENRTVERGASHHRHVVSVHGCTDGTIQDEQQSVVRPQGRSVPAVTSPTTVNRAGPGAPAKVAGTYRGRPFGRIATTRWSNPDGGAERRRALQCRRTHATARRAGNLDKEPRGRFGPRQPQ